MLQKISPNFWKNAEISDKKNREKAKNYTKNGIYNFIEHCCYIITSQIISNHHRTYDLFAKL
jgi:hypothetical protein